MAIMTVRFIQGNAQMLGSHNTRILWDAGLIGLVGNKAVDELVRKGEATPFVGFFKPHQEKITTWGS